MKSSEQELTELNAGSVWFVFIVLHPPLGLCEKAVAFLQ